MNIAKTYEPDQYETMIYGLWESADAFSSTGSGVPYSIVLPPPNANGNLHIGHGLTGAIEDILVRYHRMAGRDAILIPGADHAGFETWVVYEKKLQSEGKSRFDFSREELYSNIFDWVEQQRGAMELQTRALGVGASWKDLVFTLDQKVIDTAYATFKAMWDDDMIYRGEKLVNYCTTHQTSFSDIEVVHKTTDQKLYHIAYPALDRVGEIVVATTRPETLFGDVAVAVHPDDERYKDFIGTRLKLPLTDREIPIIADDSVDREFGTGAVKITPAHDPNDFAMGERHSLEPRSVIGRDGTLFGDVPSNLKGTDIQTARAQTVTLLQSEELLRSVEDHASSVGYCYKCGTVIQPLLMEQWFIRVEPLAKRAIAAIKAGDISFTPESKGRELIDYYKQLRDWNISRQPAWGIPIPAFQSTKDPSKWIFDTRVDQPTITVDGVEYRREEDTFDTWFSSGQWPFVTTDYLSKGALSEHYPLSVMETGHDILRPWVSRMIMLGLYRTDKVPFTSVYLHGLVLDEHGAKMSKSKGNVINPMDVVTEYGSDAFRLGIVAARSAGQNQPFSLSSVVAGRNFCNKLWNIARYVHAKTDAAGESPRLVTTPAPQTLADHWIVQRLSDASTRIGGLIEDYRFSEASEAVYHVIWDDLADWYVEASKQGSSASMLLWALQAALRLAHPFAPFVTEAVWQTLATESSDEPLLIRASWQVSGDYHPLAAAEFDQLRGFISDVRFIAGEFDTKQTLLVGNDSLVRDNADLVRALAKLHAVTATDQPSGLRIPSNGREAWLAITADQLYEHQTKIETKLAIARSSAKALDARLQNAGYIEKAPAKLVEETHQQLADTNKLADRLASELEVIRSAA